MESQGPNSKRDALDELLRRYMLERDQSGLLDTIGESMLAGPPTVTPSEAREADMIRRLQQRFPDTKRPAVRARRRLLKPALIATGAVVVLSFLILLWMNPFAGDDNTKTLPQGLLGTGTSSEVPDGGVNSLRHEIKENTSLLEGTGNPDPTSSGHNEEVSGDGDRERHSTPSSWMPKAPSVNLSTNSDPHSVSPTLFTPLTAPISVPVQSEPLDPFPLRSLYAQTNTQSRFFLLEPNKDHLIRGRKGTLLHIPKEAFVDASSGEAVTEMVQVEVKEVFNRSEYLKTNLSTVSNGRQLVSGGVVFVDAVAAGRRLAVAKGKELYLEFASEPGLDYTDMQLYHGEVSNRGDMNWTPSGANMAKMVPLALDQLYFDEFYCDCQGEKLWNNLLWAISDKAFANTWIATREFRQRLHALADLNYYSQGLIAYRDNVDKDLWKVDQQVASVLRDLVPQGLAKETDVERFEAFARENLGQVEQFDDRGVNLSLADARRQLLYRRVSRDESERLIRLDRLRREYAAEIKDRLVIADNGMGTYVVKVKAGHRKGSPKRSIRAFHVRQLGWANLTKPVDLNYVSTKTSDLKVRLTGEVPYESTRTFLVYQNMLSLLPGALSTGQLFRFKDVPRGAEAKIIAIGFKDGFPYLGIESVPREGGEQITTVGMRRMNIDEYMLALAALD